MLRNITVILCVGAAVAAIGILGAPEAKAAEFNCSVTPCRVTLKPDGPSAKTAHHVFIIKNKGGEAASITCAGISGEGTSSVSPTSELTLTNIAYESCLAAGSIEATVKMNGCDYLLSTEGKVSVKCPEGKEIEITTVGGCTSTIAPQGPLGGVTFHDAGTTLAEITLSISLKGMKAALVGTKASCLMAVEEVEGEYTTGNTIITAETDPAGVMASVWWGQP